MEGVLISNEFTKVLIPKTPLNTYTLHLGWQVDNEHRSPVNLRFETEKELGV